MSRLANIHNDGFMVLRRGDNIAGAMLLITETRGENPALFEYVTNFDGVGSWRPVSLDSQDAQVAIDLYCKKRIDRDADIWIVELNIAAGERLDLYLSLGA